MSHVLLSGRLEGMHYTKLLHIKYNWSHTQSVKFIQCRCVHMALTLIFLLEWMWSYICFKNILLILALNKNRNCISCQLVRWGFGYNRYWCTKESLLNSGTLILYSASISEIFLLPISFHVVTRFTSLFGICVGVHGLIPWHCDNWPQICTEMFHQKFNIVSVRYNCRKSTRLSELHDLYSTYGR